MFAQTGCSVLTLAGDTAGCRGGKLSGRRTTFTELLLLSKMLGKLTLT